jgi:hypothetical protein
MKHLIIAEYLNEDIRIGFFAGHADNSDVAIKAIEYLYKQAKKSGIHELDYFKQQQYRHFKIIGDDYIVSKGSCLTNGALSIYSIQLDSSTTADDFLRERQLRLVNFNDNDFEKLGESYNFSDLCSIS